MDSVAKGGQKWMRARCLKAGAEKIANYVAKAFGLTVTDIRLVRVD